MKVRFRRLPFNIILPPFGVWIRKGQPAENTYHVLWHVRQYTTLGWWRFYRSFWLDWVRSDGLEYEAWFAGVGRSWLDCDVLKAQLAKLREP